MVLITNASMFHRPAVERGLAILDQNQGEIWAKLEAGTDAYYQLVERTTIPFRRILDNITAAARVRPLGIQALSHADRRSSHPGGGRKPAAFCERLNEITAAGRHTLAWSRFILSHDHRLKQLSHRCWTQRSMRLRRSSAARQA